MERMSTLQFACPHCRGTFQIEPSMAGKQIACPTCHGQLMLPPATTAAPMVPPPFNPRTETSAGPPAISPAPKGTGVVVRETGTTKVVAGERVIELRRLSPEERAARRFRRNVVMLVLGLSLLFIALTYLVR